MNEGGVGAIKKKEKKMISGNRLIYENVLPVL